MSICCSMMGPWPGHWGQNVLTASLCPEVLLPGGTAEEGVLGRRGAGEIQVCKGAEKCFQEAGGLVPTVWPRHWEPSGCTGDAVAQMHAHGRGMEKPFPGHLLMWSYRSWPPPRTASRCRLRAGGSGSWHRKGRAELSWPMCWARVPVEESAR